MTDKFTMEEWSRTMKMYSIEQIEAAVQKATGGDSIYNWEVVIAELTRTQWNGQIGEVVFQSYLEDDQPTGDYFKMEESDQELKNCRSLLLSEVPGWKRDKEALKVAIEALQNGLCLTRTNTREHLEAALTKIEELHNE